jgi:tetratricopeptide (TPR) repeat protein
MHTPLGKRALLFAAIGSLAGSLSCASADAAQIAQDNVSLCLNTKDIFADMEGFVAKCSAALRSNVENPIRARLYARRSRALIGKGNGNSDYSPGIADADDAIKYDPAAAEGYAARGNAIGSKGSYELQTKQLAEGKADTDKAIADLDKALAIDPNLAEALADRGEIYGQRHQTDKALADLDAAIRLDPMKANLYMLRGTYRLNSGDRAGAIADYKMMMRVDPSDSRGSILFGYAQTQPAFDPGARIREAALAAAILNADKPKETALVQPPKPAPEPIAIGSERRVALVIGNADYRTVTPLKNPRNDAELMAHTLAEDGFKVTKVIDADQATMKRAMVEFERTLRGSADVGLFYYSGHGVQAHGKNYLVPVTASIRDEDEVPIEAIDVDDFLATMEDVQSKVNIVILDACRNNPFAGSFRSASRGLALVDAPSGTYIAYATAPGSVAEDGDGADSTYTEALAQAMLEPGIPIEQTFKEVRRLVRDATAKKQVTWDASSITGDFFFRPNATAGK